MKPNLEFEQDFLSWVPFICNFFVVSRRFVCSFVVLVFSMFFLVWLVCCFLDCCFCFLVCKYEPDVSLWRLRRQSVHNVWPVSHNNETGCGIEVARTKGKEETTGVSTN